ncbi:RibD family protein [Okeanomitos corallinicola TIOX110]|uniref:RibD family protein n=1 Tax=Okeanomitos corallinicola TIOX110 TaxID=3133117 RepID=A0ABZ2UU43_9CYAN
MMQKRPHTTVVLAMSADGKIADFRRSPARFGSTTDKAHLEAQIAAADAVVFGAGTLHAYGTTLTISQPRLLQQRTTEHKSPQPFHIVISSSGNINPDIKFFQQPVERWLLTTTKGAKFWQNRAEFDRILVIETTTGNIDTCAVWQHLASLQIKNIAVLGGGQLVASLLEFDLIDELWLTICPLILGGDTAPTPVAGQGFLSNLAPKLELIEVNTVEQEVFLHYRLHKNHQRLNPV